MCIKEVEVHYRTDKISYCRVELLEFAVKVLAPAAKAALDPETRPVPGAEQCTWCKARFTCTARAIDALQGAGELFGGSDLSVVLPAAKKFDSWLKDVEQAATERLAKGIAIPGFKLVEGDTKSVWREDAQTVLTDLGIDPEVFFERRMRTITEVKKAVGKEMAALVQGATTKPAGKPKLTTEDDPKPGLFDF